ncbi:MAG: regulatory protein RecX [Candidatus Berkelbacteria bacterium]|nr:MAG: regulatory protein RecX [Candidatus Berkelbacteria bacterium]QQG51753.1 MAG: regulatory protein RecX [Candidatus Berkelbacteria bacterium]
MPKQSALERALRLLNYRSRGKKELEKSLLDRQYEPDDINNALAQLEAIGLVNDERFAQSLAETRILVSRRGRHAIFFELIKKGIDKDLIESVLNSLDEGAELEAAKSLAESRLKRWGDLEPLKRKMRLLSLLQRRGFGAKIIRRVFDELGERL